MPDDRPRVVLEKSRTVRRRYQRSNKRFQFTASQIARIEREEEREQRAKKLRDKEKRRITEKKKRAEKEAKDREERRRLGLPDPHAPSVPASQPLLFNFIQKTASPSMSPSPPVALGVKADAEDITGENEEQTEPDTPLTGSTEIATDIEKELELDDWELGDDIVAALESDVGLELVGPTSGDAQAGDHGDNEGVKDDYEFSDCSIFYDEDVIKKAEAIVAVEGSGKELATKELPQESERRVGPRVPPRLVGGESFQDDTAALLDEFGHEFDPDDDFEQELALLDGV